MNPKRRYATLALVLLLIVGVIVVINRLVPTTQGARSAPLVAQTTSIAPELAGITGWINSEPLSLRELRGQVVLVDFWTYTCVNCIRTFPYLREWHREYASQGLVIIGIHTPEFAFEKTRENVEVAVERYDLPYAVAQDNDYSTWNAFHNGYWPAKYLIDKEGSIRYRHFGEGSYDETEQWIRTLLAERGSVAPKTTPSADLPGFEAWPRPDLTRELYAGYKRNNVLGGGYIANEEYYQQSEITREYFDLGEHTIGQIVLQGLWFNGLESVVHARRTSDFEDHLFVEFQAKSVNIVLGEGTGRGYTVWVTLDGSNLTEANRGADVTFDEEGRSILVVTQPRMYRLVELEAFGTHELRLSSTSDQFALFAFTFGSYPKGP